MSFIDTGISDSGNVLATSFGGLNLAVVGYQTPGYVPPGALPTSPTNTNYLSPAYLYQEYADDDNLQALIAAWNSGSSTSAQDYLDTMTALNLAVYTSAYISGPLLDWVGVGIYGYPRPTLSSPSSPARGPLNTGVFNTLQFDGWTPAVTPAVYATSDDVYKRCLTWHRYTGDGKQFSIPWLKRRVARFLVGVNGTAPPIDQTFNVSVRLSGINMTITIPQSPPGVIFQEAVKVSALELPFQYDYTVDLVEASDFGNFVFGESPFGAV